MIRHKDNPLMESLTVEKMQECWKGEKGSKEVFDEDDDDLNDRVDMEDREGVEEAK
jgi:hypothetical protein